MASDAKRPPYNSERRDDMRPLIVGVGASAAAIGSIERFLSKLSPKADQAVVLVVQDREALDVQRLHQFLQKTDDVVIAEIQDGMTAQGGAIYLCTPNTITTVQDDRFAVRAAKQGLGDQATIDSFLVSLGEERAEEAIGVVLAGTGNDGALGVATLKDRGGLAIVERTHANGSEHLADSKWAATIADLALPAEDIAKHLSVYVRYLQRVREKAIIRAEERQRMLLAELQHRVRNTLGIVRSIAKRSALTSATVEEYAMHLDGRLNAFARTRGLLTRDPEAGVDLEYLIVEEMLAHNAHEGEQIDVAGPLVRLRPKAAETVALAIHELATNSVKYGSLSKPGGRIAIGWHIKPSGNVSDLELRWVETGGPSIDRPPERRGFGTELLERSLAYELKATTTLGFAQQGLQCSIVIPLSDQVLQPGVRQ